MINELIVLIADDEEDIRDILAFSIKSKLNCTIYFASNGEEAIEILKKNSVGLVFCDYNMPLKNGGEVYKEVLKSIQPCAYVLCSTVNYKTLKDFEDQSAFLCSIIKPAIIEGLNVAIEKFKTEFLSTYSDKVHAYTPISIGLLFKLNKMPGDIFIKISEDCFIRIIKKGDSFDEIEYAKYIQKSVSHLYTFNLTNNQFIDEIERKILSIKSNTSNHYIDAQIQIHSILISTLKDLGFNERLLPAITKQFEETASIINKNKSLSILLNRILKNERSYLSTHSFLIAAYSLTLATKLEWLSEFTHTKLAISSLMHDIFLDDVIENETLMLQNSRYDHNFLTHPEKAVELLDQIRQIPANTSRIILEQHEIGFSKGIPNGKNMSELSPLGSLFSFCHFLADHTLTLHARNDLTNAALLKLMMDTFTESAHYKNFFKQLEEISFFEK